ncbi:MAG: hypothetical protein H6623_05820 [Bdellovibrionaceae bacterium]|nr:hypothetical protein [Pseudobdellovibrionaceae bacterium]
MIKYLIPGFIVLFGFMTLREGGSVLFFDGVARQEAGAFVPFVLWFNFLTGFALVTVGVALFRNAKWSFRVSAVVAALSFLVLAAFLIFVAFGGRHEVRTLIAMPLRTLIWVGIAYWCSRVRKKEFKGALK